MVIPHNWQRFEAPLGGHIITIVYLLPFPDSRKGAREREKMCSTILAKDK